MTEKNTAPINGGYPLHTYEDLYNVFVVYITNQEDRDSIRRAYDFILEKHQWQVRKSGEPYYHHLLEVAYILATLQCGPSTIIAGLLHDVVEDTDTSIDVIKENWGEDVATIVDSLTKIQRLKLSKIENEEFEAEDHRKIFLGMAKDIRVIVIKLADRLHNLRTLGALSHDRQIALSKETLDVFVPIAHRLGLESIKSEMADICLSYLHPDQFKEINKLLSKKAKTLNKSLDAIKKRIADILFENNIPFEISARVKSIFSIYEKIYKKGHLFDEIYDILALRIITKTEIQCYEILGLIHKTYKPVPGRVKDYIAMPKPNLYQSLHTTIISGDGNFYEIQIRTEEMDHIAETGIASHWAYKEGSGYNPKQEQKEIENKLHWFRDFVSLSNNDDSEMASEYMSNLTHDIFEANVYVFTPKGKVLELPAGSTPVDFAYRIHSKVGSQTTGAIVNNIMVPLNTVLKTGDVVEIKTSKTQEGPNESWLDFVVTATAKSAIKRYVAKRDADLLRDDKIQKGKQSCLDAFTDRGLTEEEMMEILNSEKVFQEYGVSSVDDLFIAVFGRKPVPSAIIDFLHIKKKIDLSTAMSQNVRVSSGKSSTCPVECNGASGIAMSLASCCTPIPGDEIIGYITKGKGITVHRKTCPNVANEKERLIDVHWRKDIQYATYPVDILVEANDRPNLVVNVMTVLTNNHVPVNNLHASMVNGGACCHINLTLMISDAKRLNDIMNILLNINGVFEVIRIIH